jgi:hypothetical protein
MPQILEVHRDNFTISTDPALIQMPSPNAHAY